MLDRSAWCRPHKTTRLTPAQAASLTDTWHDVEWIAMPSGRVPPSGFGMFTRRDGVARYAPQCTAIGTYSGRGQGERKGN